jgi:hypothetical protein
MEALWWSHIQRGQSHVGVSGMREGYELRNVFLPRRRNIGAIFHFARRSGRRKVFNYTDGGLRGLCLDLCLRSKINLH